MRLQKLWVAFAGVLLLVLPAMTADASQPRVAFGFNAQDISGISGKVRLTGGGSFDLTTFEGNSAGGFRCLEDVSGGPLDGCLAGEGVRWDTVQLLPGTQFRCVAGESLIPATTSPDLVVLLADFYRAGDGIDESFTARMIVSSIDIDPNLPGVQNVWIQGVGCDTAQVNFHSP